MIFENIPQSKEIELETVTNKSVETRARMSIMEVFRLP